MRGIVRPESAALAAPASQRSPASPASPAWRRSLSDAWALARPFWQAQGERRSLGLLAAVVALTLTGVALNVRFSAWNSQFYDALQAHDLAAFWHQLAVFGALAAAAVAAAVYRQYLQQRLFMHWRGWMTAWLLARWLQPGTAYRLLQTASGADGPAAAAPVDNPDQRIADDVQRFVSGCLDLSLGLLNASVTLLSFVAILWQLSGRWTVAGVAVPGGMVWVALAYAGAGSWLAQRLGRPLLGLNAQQQRVEADFRYALVQVRTQAEAVALANGEAWEQRRLLQRFEALRSNWWRLIGASKRLTWFSAGYGQVATVFPLLAAAPRYFAGQLALGGLMQTAQAFGQVQGALSWFIDNVAGLADWHATVARLAALAQAAAADGEAVDAGGLHALPALGPQLALAALRVRTPAGRPLLAWPQAELWPGRRVLITGPSGCGKSTLLRLLAGLCRHGDGVVHWPRGARVMTVPQRPRLPDGTLAEALTYPGPADAVDRLTLEQALVACGLQQHLAELDTVLPWAERLSPGEQQRLQFARVLLQRPDWVFLDEATSALDGVAEAALYTLLAQRLPGMAVVSVGHRDSLRALHGSVWSVVPGGHGSAVLALQPPVRRAGAQQAA